MAFSKFASHSTQNKPQKKKSREKGHVLGHLDRLREAGEKKEELNILGCRKVDNSGSKCGKPVHQNRAYCLEHL